MKMQWRKEDGVKDSVAAPIALTTQNQREASDCFQLTKQ